MTSFITKPRKKQDGTFWACRRCSKLPTSADQDLYMENLGTEQTPRWITCTDLDCFIAQGGTKPDPNAKPSSGGGFKKTQTPEQKINYKKACSELAWAYAKEKSKEIIGNLSTEEKFKLIYEAMMK